MNASKKKIYKVNGRTFYSGAAAKDYIEESNFLAIGRETFEYKGQTIICIDVESK